MKIRTVIKKYLVKMLLVWMGFFSVALQIYIFVLAPQGQEKKRLSDELSKISVQYEQAQAAASETIKSKYSEQISGLSDEIGGFAANYENSSNLTFDISRLAEQLKLSSLSIKTKVDQPIEGCNHISENRILINFTSAFNQFYALLNTLERHRPVIFIDTFSISRPQPGQEGNEVKMELAVYVTKQSAMSRKEVSKNKS
jgi:hypothetical protein